MRHPKRLRAPAAASAAILLLTGCAGQRAMQRGAQTAADQVAALKTELQQKADAETTYYDGMLEAMAGAVSRSRQIRIEKQLDDDARKFVAGQAGQAVTGAEVVQYMQDAVSSYESLVQELESKLEAARGQLDDGRRQLADDGAKLSQLQSKLRVLAEAQTKKQLAGFLFGFVTQTVSDPSFTEALKNFQALDPSSAPPP